MGHLAANGPSSVRELAVPIGLTYMGTKAQCLVLEKAGFLDVTRRRLPKGRPEILYGLTPKARALFPDSDIEVALGLLAEAAGLFGAQAPRKLLYSYFKKRGDAYAAAMKETAPALRARELARLRSAEGCFARFEPGPPPVLVEEASQVEAIFYAFPEALKFEADALSHALGHPLRRLPPRRGEAGTRFEILLPAELPLE